MVSSAPLPHSLNSGANQCVVGRGLGCLFGGVLYIFYLPPPKPADSAQVEQADEPGLRSVAKRLRHRCDAEDGADEQSVAGRDVKGP